ncbi:MPV17 mitochondrial membrane protein-like 2, transcript variant X3 [Columba livia]|uniref:MPV17 mitochondrial membrane protein-like 2, transcript variant X1 n=1 Tax=Columba livia TaxID=8932 RepID=A0A2I0LPZ2_COLLI|nr:MPV17 mitochondrial membrane protein-like 2, transcript variant X1 [Columba livia]PKK19491.1 MPV17 mitochondrial membrane protein-like 2, transcript variant X2 [Columba livia]PKK19492.1 MPV17 mitochondrial membrane protein-like 2, transcript variant X3 [Columba livia]
MDNWGNWGCRAAVTGGHSVDNWGHKRNWRGTAALTGEHSTGNGGHRVTVCLCRGASVPADPWRGAQGGLFPQDAVAGPAAAAAAVPRAPAAADQHGELWRAAGGRRHAAAGLAPPPPPRHAAPAGTHRTHVRRGLQPGPPLALLVPLAGRGVPGAGHENRPEESPDRPAGGIARPGLLVLPRHGRTGGPVARGELGGAEGEILGVLQG